MLSLQIIQIMICAGKGDEFLKADNIRIFIMDKIHDFLPGGGILIPLVVIEKPDIIGKQAHRFSDSTVLAAF